MRTLIKRLHWLDYVILAVSIGVASVIILRIGGALNYDWRWERIPNYMFRYKESEERWVANLLVQGLFATIRISIYASILALILGVILGVARCSANLTIRMLARTYLALLAQDQYRSTMGFIVRQDEGNSAASTLGGLAQFVGGSVSSDGDVLYEFVQSQGLVATIDQKLDIRTHYAQHWPETYEVATLLQSDPAFSIWPDASIEDLKDYWERMVRISFDQGTGLIEVQVLAFDPGMAQAIGQEILTQSQTMINALNDTAREDAMRYATADLETSLTRLKKAREALTQFRTRTQIVDPEADLQGRMGVITNLLQQLAEALIEVYLMQDTTCSGDPRVTQALRRIEVIQERILSERENFTGSDTASAVAEDYPVLLAEYESLLVDREFAEETYRLALAAVEAARSNATRQSRYLATYIEPTLPETAEIPQRLVLGGLAALFLSLLWGVGALVYYSIRDRQ